MKSYIKENIDKIICKENIYKEIDFEKDVCKEKSDMYFINEDKELQFICRKPKSLLDYKGYFFNEPDDCKIRTKLEFKPVEAFYEDTKLYTSRYVPNDLIEEYDIIYFKFNNNNLKERERLAFYLVDKFYLDAFKKIKTTANMIKYGKYFGLQLTSSITRCCYQDIKFSTLLENNNCIKLTGDNKYILDISQGKIYVNDYVVDKFTNIEFKKDLNNIFLTYKCTDFRENIINIRYEDIILGKRRGVIYLNPIKLERDVKLKVIYQGDIDIEVYSDKENKWIALNKEYILRKNYIFNIRFNLNTIDRLNRIFFI